MVKFFVVSTSQFRTFTAKLDNYERINSRTFRTTLGGTFPIGFRNF